ncbi:hypothetical protein [Pseudidiomarina sp.]|uniref:hypothetical protein n=1 Tax=Pseudidiomarina sp. TaxID=2081707 RepID=UPI00299F1E66|nr:hypothetical protein [Pseudidiomarina sp.]MDX1705871.1 hypothetical protein [Pseudidiomarina sp.]
MSAGIIVNGWRQQSSDRRQILRWLAEARQLGFACYSLHRVRQHYWLCCMAAGLRPNAVADIAVLLQHQFKAESHLLYLQFDAAQLICVHWQEFRLRSCIALSADEAGLERFRLLCQGLQITLAKTGAMQPRIIIAGKLPSSLRSEISQFAASAEQISPDVCLSEKVPPAARFTAISKSPSWHRRHLWLAALMVALGIGMYLTWMWWPAPEPAPVARQVVTVKLPGLPLAQLQALQHAIHELNALGGWQLEQLMLNEEGLHGLLRRTYGLNQELRSQLDDRWTVYFSNDEARLQIAGPTAADENSLALPAFDYEKQLQRFTEALPDYLPAVRLALGQAATNTHLRWQSLSLNLPAFTLLDLELLTLLLADAPVRVSLVRINPGSPANATIELQFIARQPYAGGNQP